MLVTRPIEAVVAGLPGVQAVRSNSIQGLSAITLVFAPGSDIYLDRQLASERLASVAQSLPQGVAAPTLTPLTTSTATILVFGLTSERQSLMALHTSAEWTIRRSLLAVPGVADAAVFGGETRSIQIQLHPDRLLRYGVATNDVLAAARNATGLRGAGVIDTRNQRIVLASDGQVLDPQGLARTIVSSSPTGRVTLGDVADVVEAPEPPIGAAGIMGKSGVIITVTQQYGADTLTVTNAVDAALADLKPALTAQGIVLHENLFRPANFIGTALSNIQHSLLLGGILVVVVLFLFLFNLRTAAIACTAIPLSLLTATLLLSRFGITLNTMTLGGLAIAIGEVVDDAVVRHEGARRVQTVTAHVADSDTPGLVATAKALVAAKVTLPAGTYVAFAGTAQGQTDARRELLINTLIAAVGIVLLLLVVTRNWRNLLLVLANLPFAMVGGVVAVLLTGGQLSLGALIGFVTLAGITLRNSIMMISHFEHLVAIDGRDWNAATAMEGASDRLVPIVMTSLVTALGLLPLAIGMGDPGREVEGPMAVVILGGLMTSMVLNLFVLPTLALAFGRFSKASRHRVS